MYGATAEAFGSMKLWGSVGTVTRDLRRLLAVGWARTHHVLANVTCLWRKFGKKQNNEMLDGLPL